MDEKEPSLAHQAGRLEIEQKGGWTTLRAVNQKGQLEAEIKIRSRSVTHLCRALKNQSPLEFSPGDQGRLSVRRELRGLRISGAEGSCVLSAHQAFQVADHLSLG